MIIPLVAWIHTSSVISSRASLQHVYSRRWPDSEKLMKKSQKKCESRLLNNHVGIPFTLCGQGDMVDGKDDIIKRHQIVSRISAQ